MHDDRIAAFHLLHSAGCFVMPNPWDAGSARALGTDGLQGAGDNQCRAGLDVGSRGRPGHPRAGARASTCRRRRRERAGERRFRRRLRGRSAAGRGEREVGCADGDRRALDRGLLGRRCRSALRARPCRGADQGRETSDRRKWHGGPPHRTIRGVRAAGGPTSTRRSGGSARTPKRAPTASTLRGSNSLEHVTAIVSAVSPKPVNLLINAPFSTVEEAARLGVRRISVGGTLARTAWGGFLDAAREIADAGTFTRFEGLPNVEGLFGQPALTRSSWPQCTIASRLVFNDPQSPSC